MHEVYTRAKLSVFMFKLEHEHTQLCHYKRCLSRECVQTSDLCLITDSRVRLFFLFCRGAIGETGEILACVFKKHAGKSEDF
jgi:hypothetical protein